MNLTSLIPSLCIKTIKTELEREESDPSYFSELDLESKETIHQLFQPEYTESLMFIIDQNFCNDWKYYLEHAIVMARCEVIQELLDLPEEIMPVEDIIQLIIREDDDRIFEEIVHIFKKKDVDILTESYLIMAVDKQALCVTSVFYHYKINFTSFATIRHCITTLVDNKNAQMLKEFYEYLKQENYTELYKEPLDALVYAYSLTFGIDNNFSKLIHELNTSLK